MVSHCEDIANLDDGLCVGLWRQRTWFDGCGLIADDDLIDFRHGEAGDLDWGILHDKLLQFDLKLVKIPAPLLA
jgi:hypothetical protein